jgi:biopolymer transport protein ExbD
MKMPMPEIEDPDLNVASLIDMVFLLLVYFMATASLVRSEADLGIRLPGMLAQARAVDLPDEQIIEVRGSGHVILNGREYDAPISSTASGNEPLITIQADDDARQQRVIDVMNACAAAGIKGVTFGLAAE